jgi:hypothetical protein
MICACCGSTDGVEEHHLYLRSEGCPNDLTVWLCHACHGRAHGLKRRINISERITATKVALKAQGRHLGGKRPYGFHISADGTLAPDEREQAILTEAVVLLARDSSLRGVVDYLNAKHEGAGLTLGIVRRIAAQSPLA